MITSFPSAIPTHTSHSPTALPLNFTGIIFSASTPIQSESSSFVPPNVTTAEVPCDPAITVRGVI